MKSGTRFLITLLAVCLATLASLPVLARGPASVADRPSVGSGVPASAPPQAQTVAAPQGQTRLPSQGQPARFERISTADGLSFPIVRAILQDSQGFMWFATDSGLNRYDGYEFTVYKHNPGDPTTLRSHDARAIYEDSDGVLWVGGTKSSILSNLTRMRPLIGVCDPIQVPSWQSTKIIGGICGSAQSPGCTGWIEGAEPSPTTGTIQTTQRA